MTKKKSPVILGEFALSERDDLLATIAEQAREIAAMKAAPAPTVEPAHSDVGKVPRELLERALNRVVSFHSPDVESSLSSDLRALLAGGEV
jgi:hypothetical protein